MAGVPNTGTYTNQDGLHQKFPPYFAAPSTYANKPRSVVTEGNFEELIIDFDLSQIGAGLTTYTFDANNDGTNDCFSFDDVFLPAYSTIRSVGIYMRTAAAGGTSITLGTYQQNGTAISANSLITATEGVTANMNGIGKFTAGVGASVASGTSTGLASVGANDAYLALTTAGTFTAGTGRIIITFVPPLED